MPPPPVSNDDSNVPDNWDIDEVDDDGEHVEEGNAAEGDEQEEEEREQERADPSAQTDLDSID